MTSSGTRLQQTAARVTVLGSGTSHGVPVIGCECRVCTSTDAHDKRLRPSIYVDVPDRARVLIDTTPDFRQQALRHGLRRVDAVLFTHAHADHILGFDDLRSFNLLQRSAIPAMILLVLVAFAILAADQGLIDIDRWRQILGA